MDDDKKYLRFVPTDHRGTLSRMLRSNFSLRERWKIAKAKAEATGNARMVIADFLIEEGFMKRRF